MNDTPDHVLDVRDLRVSFVTDHGAVRAVDGISFAVPRGSTTCLVGESGSGKSATARSILQVLDVAGRIDGGEILFRAAAGADAVDLAALDARGPAIRDVRGRDIGMVFQEPMSALSPVHTIGNQIAEVLAIHEGLDPRSKEARRRVVAELELVGIPRAAERFDAHTFQLSGGMRQRAMIAMALISRPALLIADEPTTALDVTTQAQILDLLAELKDTLGMSMLFITHDLGVVAEIADDVAVMHDGNVVEAGGVRQIFHAPRDRYTRHLLASLPQRADSPLAVHEPEPSAVAAEETSTAQEKPLLEVEDLVMEFRLPSRSRFGRSKEILRAVDGVSLALHPGRTLGLVGESGSGKTTVGRTILRAYEPKQGSIRYRTTSGDEVDLARLGNAALRPFRREIRMVFQDPYSSLNPRMTVEQVVTEPLRTAGVKDRDERRERAASMLRRVGLNPAMLARYPHAFSGGERQRIGIARALITQPRIVVADEAVSALDVSVRTQVLELLAELREEMGLAYLFISHDLSVVERVCDDVAVMYRGSIVERGEVDAVFADPQHGYTQALLSAVPIADPDERGTRTRVTYAPELVAQPA
ncbi:ABC transporter related [Beutenbergia cavernae DSM 12333]|uniref:ABC transporter related n=1 Tax=Beutenbergia cavernae (strain ATCC BAA-8 / DSM 12333 / CCUG 43141 / JCM 11478 / NBRC 16432 / NCIMB 13614 / HKI 0122) TaxID=471853 RepID=C5BXW7_BEUC1|nr:ABC transporter ATP-binding protein [Beutenbergia cavernae]ACQ78861.1 ABC transporter related [Beutenbergia cavernae DSM 12333]